MRRLVYGVIGLVVVMAGCSGNSNAPDPSPTVMQVAPAATATDVALNTDVVVSFSEPLQPGSVTSTTVLLTYGGVVTSSELALENGNRDVRLTPAGTLGNHRAYTIAVTKGVKSAGGTPATPFTSGFSTLLAGPADILDAAGDTFGLNPGQPDAISLSASQAQDSLTIVLSFSNTISPWNANLATSVGGYIDIDADQSASTGFQSACDYFRPAGDAGASGLGDEYLVSLFQNPNGTFTVFDLTDSVGVVTPKFDTFGITVSIPLAMLGGDDGDVNLGALVGSTSEPTDIAPSNGHLTLGNRGIPVPPVALVAVSARLPSFQRRWNR